MLSADEATTRTAYDQLAPDYAAMFPDLGAEAPEDRALIAAFADQARGRGPVGDARASAVLAWYSVIHTEPAALPLVIAELARALAPGGPLLLGFQCGQGERVDRTGAFGHPARRVSYRHRVDLVEQLLDRYDVEVTRTVVRDPAAPHETTQQAFVLGSRRTGA